MLTGYAKVDGMWTDTSDGELAENTPSRDFYVPGATPIGQPDEGTDFDAHAKQTRINFGTDTLLAGGDKLSTRFEIDFFGSATGNQRVTNTYAPVLRHAYVQWREWLVGQTWSNFQDVAALPDSVDFIGSTDGTVFVRQPQVRYTKGGFSVAVENPQTTMTPFGGPAIPTRRPGSSRPTTAPSRTSPPATPGRARGATSPSQASRANSSTSGWRPPRWPGSMPARGRWPAACRASS